jgi:hypothetical protein
MQGFRSTSDQDAIISNPLSAAEVFGEPPSPSSNTNKKVDLDVDTPLDPAVVFGSGGGAPTTLAIARNRQADDSPLKVGGAGSINSSGDDGSWDDISGAVALDIKLGFRAKMMGLLCIQLACSFIIMTVIVCTPVYGPVQGMVSTTAPTPVPAPPGQNATNADDTDLEGSHAMKYMCNTC